MTLSSALFVGDVVHQRLKPRRHRLRYSAYWLLLDLQEIDQLGHRLRFFSRNRFNLFSFYDRDHHGPAGRTVRDEIHNALREAGVSLDSARVCVLTMPRLLGYAFNPLSTYFCYGANGSLTAIVYEVHNTFGERHLYAFGLTESDAIHRCRKRFYVSPFMDMDLEYTFKVRAPDDHVSIAIRAGDRSGPVLTAALSGERRPLTDRELLRVFLLIPFLTLKVIVGIHWEALRIWLKGVRIRPRKGPAGAAAHAPHTDRV